MSQTAFKTGCLGSPRLIHATSCAIFQVQDASRRVRSTWTVTYLEPSRQHENIGIGSQKAIDSVFRRASLPPELPLDLFFLPRSERNRRRPCGARFYGFKFNWTSEVVSVTGPERLRSSSMLWVEDPVEHGDLAGWENLVFHQGSIEERGEKT